MTLRIRHCVECPKCHTRYLLAENRYANGSYLVVHHHNGSEEYALHCSCGRPAIVTRWSWSELSKYAVSNGAYTRGYGSADEIVFYAPVT